MKNEVNENASSVENNTNGLNTSMPNTELNPISNVDVPSPTNFVTEGQPAEPAVNTEIASQSANPAPSPVMPSNLPNSTGGLMAKLTSIGVVPIVVAAAAIVLIIAGISVKTVSSSPKAVFKNAINKTYKEVNNYLKEYDDAKEKFSLDEKALDFTGDIKFETNMKEFSSKDFNISDYKIGFDLGIDPKKENMQLGGSLNGSNASLDAKLYLSNEKIYLTSTVLKDPVDITELASGIGINLSDLSTYYEQFSKSAKIDTADYKYVIKTFKNALIKTLDSKKMKKSSGKFEVNGKNISATKISYELDEDTIRETIKSICEELLENDEFISKVSKMFDIDKNDLKDGIKQLKSSAKDIDLKDSIFLNIYIKGLLNDIVGVSIEIDDDEYVSFYKDKNNIEFIVDNHVKEDSYYSSKIKLIVTAVEENKETSVTVKYNGEKYATLTIREMKKEKIDLDYNISIPNKDTYKGTIYVTCDEKKDTITGEYKFKVSKDDEYVNVSGTYTFAAKDSLDSINSEKAIKVEDIDFSELKDNINNKIKEDKTLSSLIDDKIDDIEKSSLDLNSVGMVEVTEKEAITKLKNEKATVLYVGKKYYTYSESDARSILTNLTDFQSSLDFYSFYLDSDDATTEFFTEVKDVPSTCETATKTDETEKKDETEEADNTTDNTEDTTKTCADVPVIYLIKDGKVVKAIKGGTTEKELEDALAEIGIK